LSTGVGLGSCDSMASAAFRHRSSRNRGPMICRARGRPSDIMVCAATYGKLGRLGGATMRSTVNSMVLLVAPGGDDLVSKHHS